MPPTNPESKFSQAKAKLSVSIVAQLLGGNPAQAINNAHLLKDGIFSPAFISYLIDHAIKSLRAEAKPLRAAVRPLTDEEVEATKKFMVALEKGEHDELIKNAFLAKKTAQVKKAEQPKSDEPKMGG